jgi:aromatic ring-opening dioxygenase LigB subunit
MIKQVPYGFDSAAKKLDEEVVELLKQNRLEEVANFEDDYRSRKT